MLTSPDPLVPRTTADIVFDQLREEIVTLALLPGTKISEADVARRLGVSRQPVRDAFTRLSNLDLLWIRPQRATVVRGFSIESIDNARFVRKAVELEVVERACDVWDAARADALQQSIAEQEAAIDAGDTDRFHALDYSFHRLICELCGYPLAFEMIEHSKRKVDRLCRLSLASGDEVKTVLNDHKLIAEALRKKDIAEARAAMTRHLSRLDETIREVHDLHSEYFD
ncbi:GntR family transcriptional regulator [Antarctobacter jejuensis]|uniref:GntR family transcriptional regulator n=1 Tax=Antarctobacter jejuensis TaxID=1439938 RepID=UPI003FD626AA